MQREPENRGGARSLHGEAGGMHHPSPGDERVWSAVCHASVLAWPFTGLLPVVPLIIWLLYKDRSPRIGFHALQSLWYQVGWFVIFTVAGAVSVVLAFVTLGIALLPLIPLWIVLGLWPFVHGLYAAYRVSRDEDYRYPFIADRL